MRAASLAARGTNRATLDYLRAHPRIDVATAAMELKLSVPMVTWAKRILRIGTPELIVAVEAGDIALYMAAKLSRWSDQKQRDFLRLVGDRGGGCTITSRCIAAAPPQREAEA